MAGMKHSSIEQSAGERSWDCHRHIRSICRGESISGLRFLTLCEIAHIPIFCSNELCSYHNFNDQQQKRLALSAISI